MNWKKVASIIFTAGIIISACQPETNTQIPGSENQDSPMSPTATADRQQISTPTIQADKTEAGTNVEPTTQDLATPIPGRTAFPEAMDVSISVDGLNLVGTFYTPQNDPPPWPGVILLHMLYSDRSQWGSFPQLLAESGYGVLSVDLRGHGETGGTIDWDLAANDLEQIWNYLISRPEIDQNRTAMIGASIGANLALVGGSNEESIITVVMLSPGLNYAGVKTEPALISFGDRPVLIVASQEDTYAADSSVALDKAANGESRLILYDGAGHGTYMFEAEPDLSEKIIGWLDDYLE
jgi:pimeloyl-ACP methyl ester carboxylesterase